MATKINWMMSKVVFCLFALNTKLKERKKNLLRNWKDENQWRGFKISFHESWKIKKKSPQNNSKKVLLLQKSTRLFLKWNISFVFVNIPERRNGNSACIFWFLNSVVFRSLNLQSSFSTFRSYKERAFVCCIKCSCIPLKPV